MSIENAIKEAIREGLKEALAELKTVLVASPAAAQPASEDSLVGVEEAARRLGLAVSTVYQRAAELKLPSVKDGTRLLFRPKDLDAYVAHRRRSVGMVKRLAAGARARRANELPTAGAVRRGVDNAIQNAANDDRPEARNPRGPSFKK